MTPERPHQDPLGEQIEGTMLGTFEWQSCVDRPHCGVFMGYIMVGVFGWAARGPSWVILGQFWAYLRYLAGICCLLEAILANLAALF